MTLRAAGPAAPCIASNNSEGFFLMKFLSFSKSKHSRGAYVIIRHQLPDCGVS